MTDNEGIPDSDEPGMLTKVADLAIDLATGATVPAPIRRNFFKAVGRLSAALVDIPVAYLEGKADEKRAEAKGRVQIIETTSKQIAEKIEVDPEYARVALRKYGERIVKEQVNLDSVVQVAVEEIQKKAIGPGDERETPTEAPEISDDWLNHFEKEAAPKSTKEMQLLFGRILAGEIQHPSSFSIKTVKLAGELDGGVAKLFQTLCSLSIRVQSSENTFDVRVASLGGVAGANALKSYGLGFEQLNVLQEFGLIIPDYNSYMDYGATIGNEKHEVPVPFLHKNECGD